MGHKQIALELNQKLGFETTNYAKWANKNIVNNSYAIEGEDYEVLVKKTKTTPGRGGKEVADLTTIALTCRLWVQALDKG